MRRGRLFTEGEGGKDPKKRLRASRAQEAAVAKDLRGKVQLASGSRPGLKGDVVAEDLLVECKRTDKVSYSLKLAEWRKIKLEARMANKLHVMAIEIQDEKLAVISWSDFCALTEKEPDDVQDS